MSKLHTFISGSAEWTFYFVVSGNQRPSISKTEPILLAASCLSKYSIHVFISFTIFRSKVNLDSFLPPLNSKRVIPFYGGEGNGTPLQYSCLENPMDGGAWKAAVQGVAKSRTRPRDFTFTFHFCALEREMATHSSVPAWRIPGTGEPGGLPSMGSHRVGRDWSDVAAAAVLQNLLSVCLFDLFVSLLSPLWSRPLWLLSITWIYCTGWNRGLFLNPCCGDVPPTLLTYRQWFLIVLEWRLYSSVQLSRLKFSKI